MGTKINCNPPKDCFECPYDECINSRPKTRSETEYSKYAGLASNGCDKIFPLAKDYVHNRSRRLV